MKVESGEARFFHYPLSTFHSPLTNSGLYMSVVQGIENLPSRVERACVGVGVFDGVHWGHRAIFEKVLETADKACMASVALTFDRHPAEVLAPSKAPMYISSLDQRVELIKQTGIEYVVIAEFNDKLAQIPRNDFLVNVLHNSLKARAVVVGANFRFGRDREGDVRYLKTEGQQHYIETTIVSSVIIDGAPVSSTRIRGLLAEGNVKSAANMLGHSFVLRGKVVVGRQVGRTLGFPTANVEVPPKHVTPMPGVYAVRVVVGARTYTGLCNVGNNPTFGCTETTTEVHLMGFDGDLYGHVLDVEFIERIRGEVRFNGPDELVKQINKDISVLENLYGIREL